MLDIVEFKEEFAIRHKFICVSCKNEFFVLSIFNREETEKMCHSICKQCEDNGAM